MHRCLATTDLIRHCAHAFPRRRFPLQHRHSLQVVPHNPRIRSPCTRERGRKQEVIAFAPRHQGIPLRSNRAGNRILIPPLWPRPLFRTSAPKSGAGHPCARGQRGPFMIFRAGKIQPAAWKFSSGLDRFMDDQLGNRHIREFEPLASPFSPTCCLGRRYGCNPSLRAGPFETGAEGGS